MQEILAALLALVAAVSWGTNSHLLKRGMKGGQDVYLALFIRSLAAFPFLFLLVILISGPSGFSVYFAPDILFLLFMSSALIVVGDTIFMYSLDRYTVSLILPITSIYPLVTAVILILTGEEKIRMNVIIGTTVIIVGVSLVTSGRSGFKFQKRPLILGLSSALCWGTSIYFIRKIFAFDGTDAIAITGIRLFLIGMMGLLVFVTSRKRRESQRQRPREAIINSIKYIFLSGLIGWTIGATIFFFAIQIGGAAIPTPVSSTNPIIATLIGLGLGIEEVSRKQFSGIVMSVLGTIIIVL